MHLQKANLNALTALRGLAAWWVVFYHIKHYIDIPGINEFIALGYLAVDFFFVLSGFIISYAYYDKIYPICPLYLKNFLLKRINRIYPLHIIILIAYLSIPVLYEIFGKTLPEGKYSLDYFITSMFLVHNWSVFDELAWNIPSWSISTELFAYLIFPIFAWIFHKVKYPFIVPAMLLLSYFLLMGIFFFAEAETIGDKIPQLGLLRCVSEFVIGICCYKLIRNGFALNKFLAICAMGLAIILLVIPTLLVPQSVTIITTPLAALLLVYGTLFLPNTGARVLSCGPLLLLGEISYSTYILHYLLLDWFKLLTPSIDSINLLWIISYVIVLFFASWISYTWIEDRCRQILNRRVELYFPARAK